MKIKILILLLFCIGSSYSQDTLSNNKKELIELLDKAREDGASAEQLREIIRVYNDNHTSTLNKKEEELDEYGIPIKNNIANEKLVLDEKNREVLDDIVKKMLSNNESDESVQSVVNLYKSEFGRPANQKNEKPFFTPILIERLSSVLATLIISLILLFIYKKQKPILKGVNMFINSKSSTYTLELIFPIILTSLFYMLVETKRMSVDRDTISGLVSFLFFFILVLEWIRRKKDKTERVYYFKYLYIGLMILISNVLFKMYILMITVNYFSTIFFVYGRYL